MAELFTFQTQIDTWRFTDAKKKITFMAVDYEPQPIKRERWDRSLNESELTMTAPSDIEPFSQFLVFNPATVLTVTIVNSDTGDVEFIGKVSRAKFTTGKKREVELTLLDITNVIRGDVPSERYSPGCNFRLFDPATCGVDPLQFKVDFPVADAVIDAFDITHANLTQLPPGAPGFPGTAPDGYWTTGFAENGAERVYIVNHVGSTITVISPFVRLSNVTIEVFAGCDKQRSTCINKFDIEINFGGFPFVPTKNPVTESF